MNSLQPILEAQAVFKSYSMGTSQLEVLKGIDFRVFPGEAVSIMGSSGAGKSTLLHILGTLDRPTSGVVRYNGESLHEKTDDALAKFRNQVMGFVFQFHHLLPEFSAIENVLLPCQIAGVNMVEAHDRALQLLEYLGLRARMHHYPTELSGGEQQRVAIARALIRQPKVLLADEPTGNLDSANCRQIQDLFFRLKSELGLTLVVVTHDRNFASRFPRRLSMQDGRWV